MNNRTDNQKLDDFRGDVADLLDTLRVLTRIGETQQGSTEQAVSNPQNSALCPTANGKDETPTTPGVVTVIARSPNPKYPYQIVAASEGDKISVIVEFVEKFPRVFTGERAKQLVYDYVARCVAKSLEVLVVYANSTIHGYLTEEGDLSPEEQEIDSEDQEWLKSIVSEIRAIVDMTVDFFNKFQVSPTQYDFGAIVPSSEIAEGNYDSVEKLRNLTEWLAKVKETVGVVLAVTALRGEEIEEEMRIRMLSPVERAVREQRQAKKGRGPSSGKKHGKRQNQTEVSS